MKLSRKTIIENIYRLNYEKIEMNKENPTDWREILNELAVLNYDELLKNYISALRHSIK
tara:strand:+ start:185 stop:361 length:177 start_codon:yes stop_codon:yes gene_type:complete